MNPAIRFRVTSKNLLGVATIALFLLFIVMLPRYTETAKVWYLLLILTGFFYLVFDFRQIGNTTAAERTFFTVMLLNFAWMACSFYINDQPGRGAALLWGRHFYYLFLIPMFFLFRKVNIPDRVIFLGLLCSVVLSLGDILIDIARNQPYLGKGMNQNGFGPIQLGLSGILLLYFVYGPDRGLKWLALAGFLVGIATVVFSHSRSTWMTTIALCVLFAFYLARPHPLWKQVGITAVVLALLSSSYFLPIVKGRIDNGLASVTAYFASDDYLDDSRLGTFGTRMELWKTGWKIFLENPVTGAGLGSFEAMANTQYDRFQVNPVVDGFMYVHNQYIAALATRGIPGLVLLLLVLILPIYIAMTYKSSGHAERLAPLAVILISLNYLIGNLPEDHLETKPATMFLSVMLALWLARISRQGQMPADER